MGAVTLWPDLGDDDQIRELLVRQVSQVQPVGLSSFDGRMKVLYLYVTRECNLRCRHCWISAGPRQTRDELQLSLEEFKRIIDDAKALGVQHIKITGGEPFVYPKILQLIRFAVYKIPRVTVETNGMLLKPETIEVLSQFHNLHLNVSLDGATPETHIFLRRHPESFSRTVNNLQALNQVGIPFSVVTVCNKVNLHQISRIVKFAFDLGAATHRTILNIHPLGRGTEIQKSALDFDDVLWVVRTLYGNERWRGRLSLGESHSTLPPALQHPSSINLETCNWAFDLCGVLSNGLVAICGAAYETLGLVAGNLHKQSLGKIWVNSGFFRQLRSIEADDFQGICGNCVVSSRCRGLCRVNAFAAYGELNAPYPLCQMFYEKGAFPTYAMVNPDRDCSYSRRVTDMAVRGGINGPCPRC